MLGIPVALLLAGCGLLNGPDDEDFAMSAESGFVMLRNNSDVNIRYVLLEERTDSLFNFHQSSQWQEAPPGLTIRLAYRVIRGYTPQATVAVVHWRIRDLVGERRIPLR